MKWSFAGSSIAILVSIIVIIFYSQPKKVVYDNFHYATFSSKELYGDVDTVIATTIKEKIFGGIVSHHLYVATEIARFYAGMKNQRPKTVLLVGPNHYSLGNDDILLSRYPYQTPWGVLEPDMVSIDKLMKGGVVVTNEKPFEIEHSIASNVAYIKAFFPDAKLIPIILKRNTPRAKLDELVVKIQKSVPEDTLVIASVDFSHHSKEVVSEFHDTKSISTIENFDLDRIFNLEIDSPASIYTLLSLMKTKGAKKMEYTSTNSAKFGANFSSEDVTSYLFSHFTKGNVETNENVSILSFGDMMFDRGVREQIEKGKNPFEFIRGVEGNFLRGVDVIMANLEGPIIETNSSNCQQKFPVFQFASTTPRLLADAHINLVNLANNHSGDCFETGFTSTVTYLDRHSIGHVGGKTIDASYTIQKIGNKSIVFLGIDQVTEPVPLEKFNVLVKELKQKNDAVIVNIHWGYEYDRLQSKEQESVAHALIDSGADVIFGHHPHVIQPFEIYKGKAIFYSLGNFIFDQQTSDTNKGVGVGVILEDTITSYYIFPYKIIKTQPTFFPYKEMVSFCDMYLKQISQTRPCRFQITRDK